MSTGQRIIDAIIAGKLVSSREPEPAVFVWTANAAEQLTALVDAERDYPCKCGKRLHKDSCVDCSYTAMEKSRKEHGW